MARQTPLSIGILQARILEWVAMPSSRGSSTQGSNSSLMHYRQILYHLSHQGKPIDYFTYIISKSINTISIIIYLSTFPLLIYVSNNNSIRYIIRDSDKSQASLGGSYENAYGNVPCRHPSPGSVIDQGSQLIPCEICKAVHLGSHQDHVHP